MSYMDNNFILWKIEEAMEKRDIFNLIMTISIELENVGKINKITPLGKVNRKTIGMVYSGLLSTRLITLSQVGT